MKKWIIGFVCVLVIGVVVYVKFVHNTFTVPRPDQDTTSTFIVPKPSSMSVIAIPLSVDFSKILTDAVDEISNPISQGSSVINLPTQLHIEHFVTELVEKTFIEIQDKVEQETRRECARSEERCSKVERRVEKICRDVPWPLSEICDAVEKTVCIATEVTCVAYKTVVVSTKVIKVPIQVTKLVEEEVIKVVDKVANTDAEVDHTVNLLSLDANVLGDRVSGHAVIEIKVKINARLNAIDDKIKLIEVNGLTSCGYDEPMRKLRLHFGARLETLQNLAVAIRDQSLRVEWIDDCELTAFDVDVEDLIKIPLVKKAVQRAIDKALAKGVDKLNGKLSFQDKLVSVWPEATSPIELEKVGFLTVNPEALEMSPITGYGKKLSTVVAVKARPVISEHDQSSTVPPVPNVRLGSPEEGVNISVAFGPAYDLLGDQLLTILKEDAPDLLNLEEVELFASDGKLVVAVTMDKPAKGTVYLIGSGELSDDGYQLSFPELDFTIESRDILLQSADVLFHDKLRELLRGRAVIDFRGQIENLLVKNSYIMKELDDSGSILEVFPSDGKAVGFAILPSGIRAVVNLEGLAEITLSP